MLWKASLLPSLFLCDAGFPTKAIVSEDAAWAIWYKCADKQINLHMCKGAAPSILIILCFEPEGTGSHGNQIPRGEKSLCFLSKFHPTGGHNKPHESHDNNNIPHLCDIVQQEFLLNRGISQGKCFTGLKTSGVPCKSETGIMLKTLEVFIVFLVPSMYVISVGLGLVVYAELPDSVESRDFVVRMSADWKNL